jgi:hypothetical protein
MSLFPIGAQPISFDTSPLAVKCKDPEAPLLIGAEDRIIFQLGLGCCDDTEYIDNPNFQAGWVTAGRWTVGDGIASSSDGANQASIEYQPFQPDAFTSYCIAIQFDEITGDGVRVTFGGVEFIVSDSGLFTATVVAQNTNRLNIALIAAGTFVRISSAQVSASPSAIELDLIGCEDGDVLFSTSLSTGPQYFEILGNVLQVIIPMEDAGIEDGCFSIRLRYTCGEEAETLDSSTTLKVLTDCEKTIMLRVCNDSAQMGMAAGYFEMRIEASMVRPRWPMNLEEFRDSTGRIVRTQADSQTVWELHIERVGYLHHQFLRTLAMWDHLYLQGVEWAAEGADYNPLYSDATTFGAAIVELRPRQELLRAVRCDAVGAGCDPANDPICAVPDARVDVIFIGEDAFVRVAIYSLLGFEPETITYTIDGQPQGAIPIAGVGNYDLGPISPTSIVVVTITGAQGEECDFTYPAERVGFPPEQFFTFDVVGDASAGDFSGIDTTSGYWTITDNAGYRETVAVGDNPINPSAYTGLYLLFSSDSLGNPSGNIVEIQVFDVPMLPVDFSNMPSLTQFVWQVSPMTVAPSLTGSPLLLNYDIDGNGAGSPPNLVGNPLLTAFNANDNNLTTGPDFSFTPAIDLITMVNNALTQSYVDAMFIAVDAHGTSGGTIAIQGGTSAAPSATSLAARTALLSRGWSITTN